ncbi:MAG: pyridoxamine 5'-phosphate oxidase family protein [Acidobacteria bacterium]|nr:pyridoxamine 5'-phosphate oxidase family protein [Acidobacteriota bacterium]
MPKNEEWRGKIGKLSPEEIAEFLSGGVFCRLGCLDEDGWPYVVPCWFEYSGGGFYIIPRARSAWARHIQRNPRVFLCVDDSTTHNCRVLVKGEASVLEEPNLGGRWVEIARRMSLRYLGEHGPDYLQPTLVEPRWLLFVRPLKMTTWQGVDWAQRYKHSEW